MCLIFEAGGGGSVISRPALPFPAGASTCFTFRSVSSDEELTVWGSAGRLPAGLHHRRRHKGHDL